MPSTSKKQHNFMEAIAHNKAFAKKVGVPQSVGQDFSNADKGKHFSKGGDMAHDKHTHHMKMAHHHLKMAMGGMTENLIPVKLDPKTGKPPKGGHSEDMKRGGHVKKMASGGMTTGMHGDDERKGMTTAKMGKVKEGGMKAHGEHSIQERGHTRALQEKMKGNTIGNGPLYNVKGPAMKRGGKTHHKK